MAAWSLILASGSGTTGLLFVKPVVSVLTCKVRRTRTKVLHSTVLSSATKLYCNRECEDSVAHLACLTLTVWYRSTMHRVNKANPTMKILHATVFYSLASALSQAQTCGEDGTCSDSRLKCSLPRSFCEQDTAKRKALTIYGHGGTAQAYLPGAPISTTVCDAALYQTSRHRVAGWPLTRTSHRSAPRVALRIHLWSCQDSGAFDKKDDKDVDPKKCCCDTLKAERRVGESPSEPAATIEIWHARPDGSYSSLRGGTDELSRGDCRTRVHLERGSSSVSVNTVAPGSTGSLGGLGPNRWDFPPFGPPVVHVLVSAPGHATLLLDIPFLFNRKTLNQKASMLGGDWRGSAWMRESCEDKPHDVRKWVANPTENRIDVDLNVYLTRVPERDVGGSATSLLCPSMLYGLPSSFFFEPIAVCARPLLDYFAL